MISESEAAKYPFLKGAVDLVETFNLKVDDLSDPIYNRVLDRGEERVSEAILKGVVSPDIGDALTELLSFPVAVMFVTTLLEMLQAVALPIYIPATSSDTPLASRIVNPASVTLV